MRCSCGTRIAAARDRALGPRIGHVQSGFRVLRALGKTKHYLPAAGSEAGCFQEAPEDLGWHNGVAQKCANIVDSAYALIEQSTE